MGSGSGGRGILSEVNVVPLFDILLVLPVIFMIIPDRQMGLQASLPQTVSGPVPKDPTSPSSFKSPRRARCR